jgi:hypothetical protein
MTEMKRPWGHFLIPTTIGALCLISPLCHAQNKPQASPADNQKRNGASAEPATPPTPRMSDGHPDLSGVYFPGPMDPDKYALGALNGPNRKFAREFEKPSFQSWVLEKAKLMGPDLERADPEIGCAPPGGPGFFYKGNYAIKMMQTPKELVILSEIFTTYRVIYTDGRHHSKLEDIDPLYMGEAIGHWEGDTLAVDTIGVDTHTWVAGLLARPFFASDVAHYTETFRRPNLNHFLYQFTLDDPKVLTKPFTSPLATYSYSSHKPITEYYCTYNPDIDSLYPASKIPRTATGADERYFDEQEYETMSKQHNPR